MASVYALFILFVSTTTAYRCLSVCDCSHNGQSIVCAVLPAVGDAILRDVKRVTLETPRAFDLANLRNVFPSATHVKILHAASAVGPDGRLECPASLAISPGYLCRRRHRPIVSSAETVVPHHKPPFSTTTTTTNAAPPSSASGLQTRAPQRPAGGRERLANTSIDTQSATPAVPLRSGATTPISPQHSTSKCLPSALTELAAQTDC